MLYPVADGCGQEAAAARALARRVLAGEFTPRDFTTRIHRRCGHELPLTTRLAELDDEYDVLAHDGGAVDRADTEVTTSRRSPNRPPDEYGSPRDFPPTSQAPTPRPAPDRLDQYRAVDRPQKRDTHPPRYARPHPLTAPFRPARAANASSNSSTASSNEPSAIPGSSLRTAVRAGYVDGSRSW